MSQTKNPSFILDEQTYEVVLPNVQWKKKTYTAEELVAATDQHEPLVEHCWSNGGDERREEENFDDNGILKLIYTAPAAKAE